jgi:hypothetical protein
MIRSVLGRVLGALLLSVCALVGVQGDIGYYDNTNAESVTDENLSNHPNPVADVALRTSNSYLAGTTDTVYATFIGDFSSSGPHALGSFTQGEKSDIVVTLDRVIGELKKVLMHKDGIDGYLLSNMQVRMRDKIYELSGPRQWLDNLDVDTEALYPASGGYEPDVQESSDEVPAATALELTVEGYINYYSETGIYTGW